MAENPTRGLDLRATAEVHERLRNAARQGVAVIVHLADLDELLELADRIAVITNGILVELSPGADRDLIGRRLLGGSAASTTRRWAGLGSAVLAVTAGLVTLGLGTYGCWL